MSPSTLPSPDAPAIASPCVRRCAVSPQHGVCTGCGRTLQEIGAWSGLTPAAREAIMAGLPDRLARLGLAPAPPAAEENR